VTPESTAVALELDCRSMACPRPVIELAKAVSGVPVGALLAVLADDVAARTDIPAWCRMRGQEYAGEEAAPDGTPRHLVRRLA
jgi:TusA-related sulfurtransferase